MSRAPETAAPASFTARQTAQALVSAANAAHRVGDIVLTEQLLLQALETLPDHADALQLLGLVAKSKGDLAGAESLLRQSLAADRMQPHVLYNLGNLLKKRFAFAEASLCYEQAVRLRPDYAEALLQWGETLMHLGQLDHAEPHLRQALALRPKDVASSVALADLFRRLRRYDAAEALLRQGLQNHPDDLFFHHNLGLLLCEQMRYDEALRHLEPLIHRASNLSEIFVTIANALAGAGRLPEAINHYLKAITIEPLHYFAHDMVNRLMWELGRKTDIGKSCLFAKQALSDHPDALELSADCLITYGRLEEAEADLTQAARLRPRTIGQVRLWAALRLAQLRPLDVIALCRAGLQHDANDRDLLHKLCEACLYADRPRDALLAAEELARRDRFNQFASAYQATAHRLLGDHQAAARLYDYERFVRLADIAPPADFADLAAFHQILVPALDALQQTLHAPIYQTWRHGTQTHESLFSRPGPPEPVRQLGQAILAAAADYAASLPEDPQHPFLARRTGAVDWAGSWSVRLREGGYHRSHIHANGWISGIYYVEVPDGAKDEINKPGWLKFGEFAPPMGQGLAWEKAVRPRPGLLALFPSYLWHGSMPISGDQTRLAVSFDLVPSAPVSKFGSNAADGITPRW